LSNFHILKGAYPSARRMPVNWPPRLPVLPQAIYESLLSMQCVTCFVKSITPALAGLFKAAILGRATIFPIPRLRLPLIERFKSSVFLCL